MTNIISCQSVSRSFRDGRKELLVLSDVDFEIETGSIIGISGNSGSGKTTFLNIIGLLDRPTTGAVLYNGKDTARISQSARARIRNQSVGFVFQEFFLIREFNVIENVMLPVMNRFGFNWFQRKKALRIQAAELLNDVGLGDRLDSDVRQLSGGEKQRVAIARALIGDPAIVLCDEPTGNLDEDTEEGIKDLFSTLNRDRGATFVIVSHNASLLKICPIRYHLTHGKIEKL